MLVVLQHGYSGDDQQRDSDNHDRDDEPVGPTQSEAVRREDASGRNESAVARIIHSGDRRSITGNPLEPTGTFPIETDGVYRTHFTNTQFRIVVNDPSLDRFKMPNQTVLSGENADNVVNGLSVGLVVVWQNREGHCEIPVQVRHCVGEEPTGVDSRLVDDDACNLVLEERYCTVSGLHCGLGGMEHIRDSLGRLGGTPKQFNVELDRTCAVKARVDSQGCELQSRWNVDISVSVYGEIRPGCVAVGVARGSVPYRIGSAETSE